MHSDESVLTSKMVTIPGVKPLIEELRRIGKSDANDFKAIMQPIHYVVESDSAPDTFRNYYNEDKKKTHLIFSKEGGERKWLYKSSS